MLRILYGRSGTGKSTQVLERLCRNSVQRPQVLIVPEPQSHETERALCKVGGAQICRYAEVLSFTRLTNRIFQTAGGLGVSELDEGGRILLMYRAVRLAGDQLTVYHKPSRHPAFLQALLATVDELKSSCTTPEMLVQVGEEVGGADGEKLRDIGLICGIYHALTQETALDPRDRLTRAAEKLRDCPWAEGKDIWLDGFTDFTHQQGELLRHLIRQADSVTVTLTCDRLAENEGGTGVFSPARRTAAYLIELAKQEYVPVETEVFPGPCVGKAAPLGHLEKGLFSDSALEPVPAEGTVEVFCAQTMRSELEWTAARICRLVREEGYRYRDIGIVTRNYGAYQELIDSVFKRYGIPVFSSAMTDILQRPVLALVTAALDSAANGYRYEDVFRYLKTGLTDLDEDLRDRLENYVLKWNIRGSRWTQKQNWNWHPKGYGYRLEAEDEAALLELDSTRRAVVAPLEELRKNTDKTGYGQAKTLYTFMEQIGVPERLWKRMEGLKKAGQPALADEYRQLWDILCRGLEQCAALLREVPIEQDEFAQLFRLVLSQYDVGSIPVSLDRVFAGEMSRQTGHRVKVLFLVGADDSSIPQVSTAPGLLSDSDRMLLAERGAGMSQLQRDLLYREMTTVYQICSRPSQRLILSWAAQGAGGEERYPCFLADRLHLLFSDLTVQMEEDCKERFRLEAPGPALEQAGRNPEARQALMELQGYEKQIERLEAASKWERGRLSRAAVDQLYGHKVPMSASRMDLYKSCHFSYFMRYGLQAEPRQPAGFNAPEYGTFVHAVLEHVLKDDMFQKKPLLGENKPNFGAREREHLKELTRQAVEQYVQNELGELDGQTERFRYLFGRLLSSVQAVVDNVAEELYLSKFKPLAFELGFGGGKDLPPVELTVDNVTISVSGFVDRVDGWVHDGRLYLRVVDYKTGRKSFDLTEIWNGLGLQMLLYLFTLEKDGEAKFGIPVEGAGVLYLPAREALIRGSRSMSQETWQNEIRKQLRRSGLVLNDPLVLDAMEQSGDGGFRFLPLKVSKSTGEITGDALVTAEQLGKLGKHVRRALEAICQELAKGTISADPFWRGPDKNACQYCQYAAACHFEEGRGGDCRRWLEGLDSGEFWDCLNDL